MKRKLIGGRLLWWMEWVCLGPAGQQHRSVCFVIRFLNKTPHGPFGWPLSSFHFVSSPPLRSFLQLIHCLLHSIKLIWFHCPANSSQLNSFTNWELLCWIEFVGLFVVACLPFGGAIGAAAPITAAGSKDSTTKPTIQLNLLLFSQFHQFIKDEMNEMEKREVLRQINSSTISSFLFFHQSFLHLLAANKFKEMNWLKRMKSWWIEWRWPMPHPAQQSQTIHNSHSQRELWNCFGCCWCCAAYPTGLH